MFYINLALPYIIMQIGEDKNTQWPGSWKYETGAQKYVGNRDKDMRIITIVVLVEMREQNCILKIV